MQMSVRKEGRKEAPEKTIGIHYSQQNAHKNLIQPKILWLQDSNLNFTFVGN